MKPVTLIFAFAAFLVIIALVPQASLAQTQIPSPVLTFLGTEPGQGGGTQYNLSVSNWQLFPAELFMLDMDRALPACGDNTQASRTWVDIYIGSGETFDWIYGFCALEHPQELTTIWFFRAQNEPVPAEVYITLTDRGALLSASDDVTYYSNVIPISGASPNGYSPISVLIDPNGGTNLYPFDNNLFNYKVTYPPLDTLPANDVFLVVQPILISQDDLNTLLGVEGPFSGAELVPYNGTAGGNSGVLFRATCEDSSQTPTECPTPGTYDVKTSWNSPTGQVITAPAFLKADEGMNNWQDILTAFSESRIDPTGSGRTCCKYSDFVFVDFDPNSGQGTPLPTITINVPQEGASYGLNQKVLASYSCVGGKSCAGTVATGKPIDTSSVGTKVFSVTAAVASLSTSDDVSYTKSVSYSVLDGICLLYDPNRSAKKGGATYPIRLKLCNASGQNLSSSSIVLKAIRLIKIDSSPDSALVQDSGNANPDFNFRFDPTLGIGGGYIYNLSTKGLTAGTWNVEFTISGEPATVRHYAEFNVR